MTLCDTFRALSFRTWDLLGQAASIDHQILEETVTDLLCLELKTRCAREVITRNFNKVEEGATGADWEWWFTSAPQRKSWLGIRVQAKVLDFATQRFKHLHYRRKKHGYQTSTLQRDAAANAAIPLYCLYVYSPNQLSASWRCGSFPPASESYGCSITSVAAVLKLRRANKMNDLSSLMANAVPWYCLVCCHGYGGGELPDRMWNYVRANGLVARSTLDSVGPRTSPPAYVLALLNGELREPPDPRLQALSIFSELTAG